MAEETSRLDNLAERLANVESRNLAACQASGRSREEITLVAVTKGIDLDSMKAAYDLGLRDFGESRLQEALPKIVALPKDITWHFIGPLQSNKARAVAENFDAIHSVYKQSQVDGIAKSTKPISILFEVNIANEPQKAGLSYIKSDANTRWALDELIGNLSNCPQVQFRGLMTIGPNLKNPEGMRPYFRQLHKENERVGGKWLSMGMSDNFDVAIQEGATHIRVGSALFKA